MCVRVCVGKPLASSPDWLSVTGVWSVRLVGEVVRCVTLLLPLSLSLSMYSCDVSPGGGTVHFVNEDGVPRYSGNDEEREEAGTPAIVACIRSGGRVHTRCWGLDS
jgi:hypothetical protein